MTEDTSIYKVIKTQKYYEDNGSGHLRNERESQKKTIRSQWKQKGDSQSLLFISIKQKGDGQSLNLSFSFHSNKKETANLSYSFHSNKQETVNLSFSFHSNKQKTANLSFSFHSNKQEKVNLSYLFVVGQLWTWSVKTEKMGASTIVNDKQN